MKPRTFTTTTGSVTIEAVGRAVNVTLRNGLLGFTIPLHPESATEIGWALIESVKELHPPAPKDTTKPKRSR